MTTIPSLTSNISKIPNFFISPSETHFPTNSCYSDRPISQLVKSTALGFLPNHHRTTTLGEGNLQIVIYLQNPQLFDKSTRHYLWDCPMNRKCPICGMGIVKLMKVVHVERSSGKLFYSCTTKGCRYFDWVNALKPKEIDVGQSSNSVSRKAVNTCETNELTHFFNSAARIVEEKDVEVALNITIRKDKGKKAE